LPAEKSGERLQRGFDGRLATAGERHSVEINERALSLMNNGHIERAPSRIGDKLRQAFGHLQIVRHRILVKVREHRPALVKVQGCRGDPATARAFDHWSE